jgi:TonB family protein
MLSITHQGPFARLTSFCAIAVLLLSQSIFSQEVATQPPIKRANEFIGRWTNIDPSQAARTDAITRVEIHTNEGNLFVRMWARCRPLECDLGEDSVAIAHAEAGSFSLRWTRNSMAGVQEFTLVHDDLLRIVGQTRRVGTSVQTYTSLFSKNPEADLPKNLSAAPPSIREAAPSIVALLTEDSSGNQTPLASGFFILPDFIVTSYTAIRGAAKLVARAIGDPKTYPVLETARYSEDRDLAILRVPAAKGWPLQLSRTVVVGGIDVFVVTAHGSAGPAVSRGSITTTYPTGANTGIEINAPAAPLDAGSPVLNKRGEVIGVLTSVEEGTRVSVACSASDLRQLLQGIRLASTDGATRPSMISGPTPAYTQKARDNKVSGTVVMRVLVAADGTVKQVDVVRGLPDGLAEEAVRCMYQTKFQPATQNGQPVESWTTAEVQFRVR